MKPKELISREGVILTFTEKFSFGIGDSCKGSERGVAMARKRVLRAVGGVGQGASGLMCLCWRYLELMAD